MKYANLSSFVTPRRRSLLQIIFVIELRAAQIRSVMTEFLNAEIYKPQAFYKQQISISRDRNEHEDYRLNTDGET